MLDMVIVDDEQGQLSAIVKRVNSVHPYIIKIILTGYSDFIYAQNAIRQGVNEYCLKPFSQNSLKQLCNSIDKKVLFNHCQIRYIASLITKKENDVEWENGYYRQIENLRKKIDNCHTDEELKSLMKDFSFSPASYDDGKFNTDVTDIIKRCQKYLHDHYSENHSLESIAEKMHFNSSYFSSLFKSCVGMGFNEYLTKIRMDNAIRLLTETQKKICNISQLVGYENISYFIRLFKRRTGMSPQKYRRLHSLDSLDGE